MSTLEVASGIAVVVVVVVGVAARFGSSSAKRWWWVGFGAEERVRKQAGGRGGVAARSIATGPGQMNVSLFGFYILTANA
jgi:hypothetical protein